MNSLKWQFGDGEGVGVAGGHPLLGLDGGGGGRLDDQGAGLGQHDGEQVGDGGGQEEQDGEHEGGGQEEQDRA